MEIQIPPPSILERVAAGDASAVEACLDRFGALVWSLARRFAPDDSHAEDAVQEIFIDVWKSAGRFDRSVASEATFISMIARRRLIDQRRKLGRRPLMEVLEDDSVSAEDEAPNRLEISEEAQRAGRAMRDLIPDRRRVLSLSVMHGFSHSQIADKTGLPLGTVKSHVRRGLQRIAELLGRTASEPAVEVAP